RGFEAGENTLYAIYMADKGNLIRTGQYFGWGRGITNSFMTKPKNIRKSDEKWDRDLGASPQHIYWDHNEKNLILVSDRVVADQKINSGNDFNAGLLPGEPKIVFMTKAEFEKRLAARPPPATEAAPESGSINFKTISTGDTATDSVMRMLSDASGQPFKFDSG